MRPLRQSKKERVKKYSARPRKEEQKEKKESRKRGQADEYRSETLTKRKTLFVSGRIDSIEISTAENYIKPLVQFFRMRERRW